MQYLLHHPEFTVPTLVFGLIALHVLVENLPRPSRKTLIFCGSALAIGGILFMKSM